MTLPISWEPAMALGTLSAMVYFYLSRQSRSCPLPPGPTRLPIVGNLFDIPSSYAWKVYAEWGKKYNSDILYLNTVGQSIIVLNSYDDAKELLEKRSAIYSSRPVSVMLSELSGLDFQFGLMPYGEQWRTRRRLFKKHFSPSNMLVYQLQEVKYIHRLLEQLLGRPADLLSLLEHMTGSVALSMTYGVDIRGEGDPNLQVARLTTEVIRRSLTTGSKIVDMMPFLRYLPAWFPGASFQKIAAETKFHVHGLREGIFRQAQEKLSTRASIDPCFVSLCLEGCETEENEKQLSLFKDVAGIVYMAASDTITATLKTFILAMTCFPEVQRYAQQELDRALKGDRLPNYTDMPRLPYISALIREVFRWQAASPGGVPHKSTAPDVYKGYYIPKDSIVIFNVWAMLNNESIYPDPQEFRPERFLTSDGQLKTDGEILDPTNIVFGFGRRICPGVHIASSLIWLTVVSLLAVFNIEKALDSNGQPIEPIREWDSGAVSHPLPFKCLVKPRSRNTISLVKEAVGLESN